MLVTMMPEQLLNRCHP